jgi:hypothetical protein
VTRAIRDATTSTGTASLEFDRDPLGSLEILNDLANPLAQVRKPLALRVVLVFCSWWLRLTKSHLPAEGRAMVEAMLEPQALALIGGALVSEERWSSGSDLTRSVLVNSSTLLTSLPAS